KALEQALVLVGARWSRGAIKRELHRGGIERLAVLEFDALAELERVGLEIIRSPPALGKQGGYGTVFVDLCQRFIDVIERNLCNPRRSSRGWTEPGRLQRHRHDDAVFLALRQARQRHRRKCSNHRKDT